MATIDQFVLKIDVQGAQQLTVTIMAMEKLEKETVKTTAALGGLKSAIAGVAFGAFHAAALRSADAISDLSDATGLSIERIKGFSDSLILSGGKADEAEKMITKFFQTVDDSVNGNDKARESLEKVGITLNDLKHASEQDILEKSLQGLAKMEAGAQRTALGIELFGKSFRSVDPAKLDEALRTGRWDDAAAAIKRGADMADAHAQTLKNLETAYLNLLNTVLTALEPIIGKIGETGATVEQMEKALKAASIAMAAYLAISAVSNLTNIARGIGLMVDAYKNLNVALKATVLLETIKTALQGPVGWAKVAAAVALATGAYYGLNEALKDYNDQKERENKLNGKDVDAARAETEKLKRLASAKNAPADPNRQTKLTSTQQQAQEALAAARAETAALEHKNQLAAKYAATIVGTIGLEQDQATLIKTAVDLEKKRSDEIDKIQAKIDKEKAKKTPATAAIAEWEKQKILINEGAAGEAQLASATYTANQALKESIALREKDLGLTQQQIQMTADEGQAQRNNALVTGQISQEQLSRLNVLANIEKQHADTQAKAASDLDAAIAAGDTIKKNSILAQIALNTDKYNQQIAQAKEAASTEDRIRQSSAAGQMAYLEQLTRSVDPFKIIQDKNAAVFNNMTSALDKFVETGKLSFGDLAKSIIRDLLKIELRTQATKLFSGLGGFTGLMGLFGGGPGAAGAAVLGGQYGGAANGGPIDGPTLVGERGPEMFIPKSSGTVIPNKDLMGGGTTVTNTTINNHISAVDAQSVAQLFANNRRTLLGVVETARKELPVRQRF